MFTTPALGALRRHFPDAHLSYLVEPLAAPVVDGHPHLDEVIVAPRPRGLARVAGDWAMARRLRAARFDVAIDLHGGPRAAWFAWASGAPMRIGYTIAGRRWMYTHLVPRAPDLTPRHSVQNQFDLLAPLGVHDVDPARDPMTMPEDAAAERRIDARLAAFGIPPDARLVVIHVSAGNPFRRWPMDSFAALAAALLARDPRRHVVVLSGPSDREAAAAMVGAANARGAARGRIAAGDFDVAEVRALVRRAAVYIGGDSGPMHIAATTTTPIVELLGPTLAERSRPWRDPRWFTEVVDAGALPCRPCHQRHCVPGDFRCLTGITPARVIAAAERALETGGTRA